MQDPSAAINDLNEASNYARSGGFMIYGLVYAMVEGSQSAFVTDLSSSKALGTSLGAYYGAVGFASIISGAIAGVLWQSHGAEATFSFGAVLAILAALALLQMKNVRPIA